VCVCDLQGGEGQGQGREAAAAAAVRVHDQERGRPPRGRLPVAQIRPESRQEQPIPEVHVNSFSVLNQVFGMLHVTRPRIRVLTTSIW
jgi:hypothetical protein